MRHINKDKIKTWFVTGASSGVGHELCKQLLDRGYNIIATSRRVPDFDHKNALCLSVDVTKPETIKGAIIKGIEKFGKIDVLSNNAGISANITCEEETIEHIKHVMDVNYFGTFNTINALLPHFRNNKNGTILNNTSQSGITPRLYGTAYCSSKHAIEGLTGVCWLETYKFCRVMAFELGWFSNTEISKNMVNNSTKFTEYKNLRNRHTNYRYTFENNLSKAVSIIIDSAERKNLPRRLMIGKDSLIKAEAEIKFLKRDLYRSRNLTKDCSSYKVKKILDSIF